MAMYALSLSSFLLDSLTVAISATRALTETHDDGKAKDQAVAVNRSIHLGFL